MAAAAPSRRPALAVCGASGRVSPEAASLAEALGAEAWRAGFDLVSGGLDGVMEAAARGYARARGSAGGGIVVGILPGDDPARANAWCDIVIPTGMGYARNTLVVLAGDGVVLCGGGSGTLSEAALAWQLRKPLVALASSGGWAAELAGRTLDHRRTDAILAAATPAEAVAKVKARLGEARPAAHD